MSRRFQFSLASLLVATALVAVAVNGWTHWRALRQRALVARQRFADAERDYHWGTGTWLDLTRASKDLLHADFAIPLVPGDRFARLSYLDRTRHLYRKAHANAVVGMASGSARSRVFEMLKECHDVEDRLGLPHVDDLDPLPAPGDDLMDDDENTDGVSLDETAPPPLDDLE